MITKSYDGGQHWSDAIYIPSAGWELPVIYQYGSNVWVVASKSNILKWCKSSDYGETWGDTLTLIDDVASQGRCLAGSDSEPYFLYYSYYYDHLILSKWNSDINDWTEPWEVQELTRWNPQPLYFLAFGDTLYILCNDVTDYHYEDQFFMKSTDCGRTWTEPYYLSDIDSDHSQYGAMAVDGRRIFVTWFDYKYGSSGGFHGDILGRLSTDEGDSWSNEIRITYDQNADWSSPVVYGNRLNVVWGDIRYRDPPDHMDELSHRFSFDEGNTWSSVELLTPHPGSAYYPYALINPHMGGIHLIYKEYIEGSDHLFYRYGFNFTSIEDSDLNQLPKYTDLLAIYPNPFNPSTTIKYTIPKHSDADAIAIYNLLGQKIDEIRIFNQNPSGSVLWDASEFSSGIYFARFSGVQTANVIKLVLMK